jgi:hypothetical protein
MQTTRIFDNGYDSLCLIVLNIIIFLAVLMVRDIKWSKSKLYKSKFLPLLFY